MKTPSRSRVGRKRLLAFVLLAVVVLLALAPSALVHIRAARLLLATLEPSAASNGLALATDSVRTSDETVALPDGSQLRSRMYGLAAAHSDPQLLLLHGVHPLGIDEPRLARFARALAASGFTVHTPELPQLLSLDVDSSVVQRIGACASALRTQHGGRKLAAFGISFTGGLLLMAAATAQGQRDFSYVVTIGAHADLRRVARHFAGEPARGPNGEHADSPVNMYGARVLIAAYAPALFAPEDVVPARAALRLYLGEHYAESGVAAQRLSATGQARLTTVLARDERALPPLLAELARTQAASLAALSPAGHLGQLRVPTLLLHGTQDPIVPSTETAWLAREVPPAALRQVLITPALRHAEASGKPSIVEQLALIDFVAAFLQ